MNVRDLRVLVAHWDPQVCQRIKAAFDRSGRERRDHGICRASRSDRSSGANRD